MVNLLVFHYTEEEGEEINFQKLQITSIVSEAIIFYWFHDACD